MALYDDYDSGGPMEGGDGGQSPATPRPGGGNIPCAPGVVRDPVYGCSPPPATDGPCPGGQCRDVVTNACRNPGKNEKINETDDITRPTGGGRGFCRQRDPGKNGSGGSGGGAAPRSGSGTGPSSPGGIFDSNLHMFDLQSNSIWNNLQKIVDGGTRYSPEVMANLDSQAKLTASAQAKSGERAANQDAIARGMGRSSNRDVGLARRTADATYAEGTRSNRIAKVNADFNDKMMALNAQEKWLDDMQKYTSTLDQTAAGREAVAANVALGYARIAAERAMLTERIKADLQMAQMGNDLGWFNAISGMGV